MDCHDVRVLWALQRRGDAIDPTERAALQQHLDACPDCAGHSHCEQVVDAALGSAMRAVTMPAGLQARLLTRLAVTRPRRWPRVAAAAAAVLLLIAGGTWWAIPRPTPVDPQADFAELAGRRHAEPAYVEQWFADRGIDMVSWRRAKHEYLWTFDIVDFRGRRVPKLIFSKEEGTAAVAEVLVLSTRQFDTRDLPEGENNGWVSKISVERPDADFVYLIATNAPGGPDAFCPVPQ